MTTHQHAHATIPVTPFMQNCSLVWCAETRRAVVIDPGGDVEQILHAIATRQLQVEKILLTHGHLDHVGGSVALSEALNVPIWGPTVADKYWLDGLMQQSKMFGFPPIEAFEPAHWLEEGETIQFGERTLAVLHCPGHTPGHVVFYDAAVQQVWVGDVLFAGSIGRSDFPGGDHATLVASIRKKLLTLGDEVLFFPGHGDTSTMGEERRYNPFVAERQFG